jgi:hypothetical protein
MGVLVLLVPAVVCVVGGMMVNPFRRRKPKKGEPDIRLGKWMKVELTNSDGSANRYLVPIDGDGYYQRTVKEDGTVEHSRSFKVPEFDRWIKVEESP